MKKITNLRWLILSLLLAVGVSSAWSADVTVTKTMTEIATANNWVTASGNGTQTCYTSFNLDDHIVISTSGEANCGSFWGNDWRLYQAKNGDVTVSANDGCTLKSITFTYTVSNSGVLKDGTTNVNSNTAVTLNGSSKTFTVGNTSTKTNGQVKITQISVTYSSGKSEAGITYSPTSVTLTQGQSLTAPTFSNPHNLPVSYESNNTSVATVTNAGVISLAGGTGTAVITATTEETTAYNAGEATFTITVNSASSGDTYNGDWVASEKGFTNGQEVTSSAINSDLTIFFDKGTGSDAPAYYTNGTAVRVYSKGTFTISGGTGVTITAITITYNKADNTITANTGNYSESGSTIGSWAGSAQSVTFSESGASGHRRIAAISVTYTKESGSLTGAGLLFNEQSSYNITMEVGDVLDVPFTKTTTEQVSFEFDSEQDDVATYVYDSTNNKVTITATAAGSNVLTATSPEGTTYAAGTATLNITVNKKPNGLAYETNSYTITVGHVFTTPTLTNPNSLVVTYSGNNDALASVNSSTGALTFVSGATGEITVTATWAGNATYEAGTASYTLRVLEQASGSDTYTKVTSTSDLIAGEEYLIVYEGENGEGSMALGAIEAFSSNHAGGDESVTITGNTIIITNEPVAVLTLGKNGNYYTFQSSLDNQYLTWPSGNQLNTSSTVDNSSSWTLTYSGDVLTIANVFDSTRKLQYNSGSPRFACYTSSQQPVALYKKGSSTPAEPYVRFAEESKTVEFEAGATVTPQIAETNTASVTYTSSNNAVAEVNSTTGEVTLHDVGDVTITATSTEDATLTASYMLHVIRPNIELFVKVDNQSELVEDGEYLLVQYVIDGTTSAYAYDGKASGGNYSAYTTVTITNNKVIDNHTPQANILTLESAGEGKWYIKDTTTGYYLYCNNTTGEGGSNLLYFSTTKGTDAKYKWNISVKPVLTQITNVNATDRNILFNNKSDQLRFSCYSTNQNQVVLYKKATALADANLSYETESYNVLLGNAFTAQTLKNDNQVAPVKYYSSNPASVEVNETTGAVTVKRSGSAQVIATFYGNSQYHKSQAHYTIFVNKVKNEGLLFEETFDKLEGTGGNDGQFLGELGIPYTRTNGWNKTKPATGDEWGSWTTDDEWTLFDTEDEPTSMNSDAYVQAAFKCAKFGAGNVAYNSKANGKLVTREINFNGGTEGTLTFSAAGFGTPWNNNGTMMPNTLTVTATNCTLTFKSHTGNSTVSGGNITLVNGEWDDFTYVISNVTDNVVLTFDGYRGFLDDIAVGGPYSVTIGTTGYSTLYFGAAPLTVPDGVKAYTVHTKADGKYTDVELVELQKDPNATNNKLNIKEGTGVVLYSENAKNTEGITYNFPFYFGTDGVTDDYNILEGSDEKKLFNETDKEYFVLGVWNGEIGFYHQKGTNNGQWVNNGAHKAFFCLDKGESILNASTPEGEAAARRGGFSLEDMIATAIENLEQNVKKDNIYYNLAGQRVMNPTKGIYIVNGKKVFIK